MYALPAADQPLDDLRLRPGLYFSCPRADATTAVKRLDNATVHELHSCSPSSREVTMTKLLSDAGKPPAGGNC